MIPWITALVALVLIGGQLNFRSAAPDRQVPDWPQRIQRNLLTLERQGLALGMQIVDRPQDQAGAVLTLNRLEAPPALDQDRYLRVGVYLWNKGKKSWVQSQKTLRDAALHSVEIFTLDSNKPAKVFTFSRLDLEPFLDRSVADLPLATLALKRNRSTFRVELHGPPDRPQRLLGSLFAKRKGLVDLYGRQRPAVTR